MKIIKTGLAIPLFAELILDLFNHIEWMNDKFDRMIHVIAFFVIPLTILVLV